jgi:hypothetical protein
LRDVAPIHHIVLKTLNRKTMQLCLKKENRFHAALNSTIATATKTSPTEKPCLFKPARNLCVASGQKAASASCRNAPVTRREKSVPTVAGRAGIFMIFTVALYLCHAMLVAQGVAIGTGNPVPNASAMLDVSATGKGLLVPRMTTANRPAAPANGLLIFNTTINRFEMWDGTSWQPLTTGAGSGFSLPFIGTVSSTSSAFSVTNTNTGSTIYGIRAASSGQSDFSSGVFAVNTSATGNGVGVYGRSNSTGGLGVLGFAPSATGNTVGVFSQANSTAGTGVLGQAVASSGTTIGVRGRTVSTEGVSVLGDALATTGNTVGVRGVTSSPTGLGVQGISSATTGVTSGVLGQVSSTTGFGVYGTSSATTGNNVGVFGQNASSGGRGVFGFNTSATGLTTGVWGEVQSTTGRGVFGSAPAATGVNAGVQGVSSSTTGIGVIGTAQATSGVNFGVVGQSFSAAGFAGSFTGNVRVTGTLSKGGGSFKIDHPLDPENKYLYHSFVESPDMMNIYNGNITTDAQGYAVIELPNWFSTLNKDFRYQLTPIGAFAQAIISEEVRENRFKIQTDKPNIKVSWQITGIRKDAFAEKHRIPVEEDKTGEERGKYLHPEEHGKPQSLSVDNFLFLKPESYSKMEVPVPPISPIPVMPEIPIKIDNPIMLPSGTETQPRLKTDAPVK